MKYLVSLTILMLLFSCQPQEANKAGEPKEVEALAIKTEKTYVTLGGESQYLEILSTSKENPILLFIHGGPAWPQTPQLRYYSSVLAETFSLVIWEQRGAGNTYQKNPSPDELSLAQIIADGRELTKWLQEKYGKEKIYLAGYSWGSLIGIDLAKKNPADYHAYIGIAQIINMDKGMKVSRNWLMEQAKQREDADMIQRIDSLQTPAYYEDELDRFFSQWLLLNQFDGATFNQASEKETEKAMYFYEDYKNYDWFDVWDKSAKRLQGDMFGARVDTVRSLELPVFLLQGRHDWNIPSTLAEEWWKQLEAPKKKLYWFENSGHGPLEEEAGKFNDVLKEIHLALTRKGE